jgi:hypothetical protein
VQATTLQKIQLKQSINLAFFPFSPFSINDDNDHHHVRLERKSSKSRRAKGGAHQTRPGDKGAEERREWWRACAQVGGFI